MCPPTVLVRWRDAALYHGAQDPELCTPPTKETVGFLVHQAADFVVVAQEMQDGDQPCDLSSIPRSLIDGMARLQPVAAERLIEEEAT